MKGEKKKTTAATNVHRYTIGYQLPVCTSIGKLLEAPLYVSHDGSSFSLGGIPIQKVVDSVVALNNVSASSQSSTFHITVMVLPTFIP